METIGELLRQTAWKRDELEDRILICDGVSIQTAEMTLLRVLGKHPRESVTHLASSMGISKGAVSQTLKRLEAKDLAVKAVDPLNSSRVSVSLTMKGRLATLKLQERRERLDGLLEAHLESLSRKERNVIVDFLRLYDESLTLRL